MCLCLRTILDDAYIYILTTAKVVMYHPRTKYIIATFARHPSLGIAQWLL